MARSEETDACCQERFSRDCWRWDARRSRAALASGALDADKILLAKPQTYMNLSGLAVGRLLHKYDVPVEELIVLVDEVSLPFGRLRIRARGSAGGHNGLKSIIGSLQNDHFIRVRMGVQPDHRVDDLTAHLLGRFRKADLETVADMIDRAAEAARVIVQESLQQAMNRYNPRQASPP